MREARKARMARGPAMYLHVPPYTLFKKLIPPNPSPPTPCKNFLGEGIPPPKFFQLDRKFHIFDKKVKEFPHNQKEETLWYPVENAGAC